MISKTEFVRDLKRAVASSESCTVRVVNSVFKDDDSIMRDVFNDIQNQAENDTAKRGLDIPTHYMGKLSSIAKEAGSGVGMDQNTIDHEFENLSDSLATKGEHETLKQYFTNGLRQTRIFEKLQQTCIEQSPNCTPRINTGKSLNYITRKINDDDIIAQIVNGSKIRDNGIKMGLLKRVSKLWEEDTDEGKGTSLRLIMASKNIDKMISQAEKKDLKNGDQNTTDHGSDVYGAGGKGMRGSQGRGGRGKGGRGNQIGGRGGRISQRDTATANIASSRTDDDYWKLSHEEIIKHFKEGSKAKGMRGPPRFYQFMWACRKTDKFAGSREELKLKDMEHAKKYGLEKEWRDSDESYKKDHEYGKYGKYETANAAEEEASPSASMAEIKKYVKKIKKMEAKMKKYKRSPSPPPSSSSEDSDNSDDESFLSSDDESNSDS